MTDEERIDSSVNVRDSNFGGFPKRLASLKKKESVRAFARRIGISDTYLGQLLAGSSEPTRTVLIRIARVAGVSIEWLVTGEGPRMADAVRSPVADYDVDASPEIIDLVKRTVIAVEEWLHMEGRSPAPEQVAHLVGVVFATSYPNGDPRKILEAHRELKDIA